MTGPFQCSEETDLKRFEESKMHPSRGRKQHEGDVVIPDRERINVMSVIQIAVLALVALVLGLFVIRPVLTSSQRSRPAPPLLAPPGLGAQGAPARVLSGEIDDGTGLPPFSVAGEAQNLTLPNDPVARLRRLIAERQVESVEILRGWMETEEEKT